MDRKHSLIQPPEEQRLPWWAALVLLFVVAALAIALTGDRPARPLEWYKKTFFGWHL